MSMKRKALAIIIILLLVLTIPTVFACNKYDYDISPDDVTYSYVKLVQQCVISWPAYEGISSYTLQVYLTGDTKKCLKEVEIEQSDTAIKLQYTLKEDIVLWQYLDVYLTGYSKNKKKQTNTIKKTIVCSVEEEDYYIAEEQEAGILPGYEESPVYYYAKLNQDTYIVKSLENKKYALVVDDVSLIDSVDLPLNYDGAYTLDQDLNAIVLDNSVLSPYTVGSFVELNVSYKDGQKKESHIHIVNVLTPQIDPINITRGTTKSLVIDCLSEDTKWEIEKVLIDNKKSPLYLITDSAVSFTAANLNQIPVGEHNLKIYYKYNDKMIGYSETTLTINVGNKVPYNVSITYDDTYPKVKVSWDADYEYEHVKVMVNANELTDELQPSLFAKNSMLSQNYITKKDDDVTVTLIYADGTEYTSGVVHLDRNLSEFYGKDSYFTDKVNYLGKDINKYISTEDELNEFIAYHIIHYGDSDYYREEQTSLRETYTIFSPYLVEKYKNVNAIKDQIKKAFKVFIEPLSYDIEDCTISGGLITFKIWLRSGGTRPYTTYHAYSGTSDYVEYPYSELHYYTNGESKRSSSFDDFKYKEIEEEAIVSTSLELELALEKGLKAIPASGSSAEVVMNKAKEVLRQIIDDDMCDYEKVLAIYDWMTYNVVYDRGLTTLSASLDTSSSLYRSLYKNSSFYAEGVFLYNIAVCNGIGAAFSIMCNIEGIPAYKVMGSVKSGSHTWTKVFVNNEWFVCDPTWSSAKDSDGNKLYEVISYDFFMLSEDESAVYENRTEFTDKDAYNVYAGNTQFDYFASQTFVYENELYTMYVDEYPNFEALIKYYTSKLHSGETILISFKMPKINTVLQNSANAAYKWLIERFYGDNPTIQSAYNISVYTRSTANLVNVDSSSTDTSGASIKYFNDVVYLRIEAK